MKHAEIKITGFNAIKLNHHRPLASSKLIDGFQIARASFLNASMPLSNEAEAFRNAASNTSSNTCGRANAKPKTVRSEHCLSLPLKEPTSKRGCVWHWRRCCVSSRLPPLQRFRTPVLHRFLLPSNFFASSASCCVAAAGRDCRREEISADVPCRAYAGRGVVFLSKLSENTPYCTSATACLSLIAVSPALFPN